LFFGIPFTRPNPDFVQSVKSQIQPETKLLIVCQEGLRSVYHFLPYLIANYIFQLWLLLMIISFQNYIILNMT
jgi:hypothetical protein